MEREEQGQCSELSTKLAFIPPEGNSLLSFQDLPVKEHSVPRILEPSEPLAPPRDCSDGHELNIAIDF